MKKKFRYRVKRILPNVYALSQCGTCTFLILGKTHTLVFDTGAGLSDPMPQIRELTDKPLIVVNSHGHYDHSAGNVFFDCPVYIHEADREVHDRHNSPTWRAIAVETLRKIQKTFFFLPLLPKKFDAEAYIHTPLFTNLRYVKEGDQFDLGGLTARVVEIPGHTPGSIGLLISELKLFLASDGICRSTWLFLQESTKLSVWRDSVKKAMTLDFDRMLTGHIFDLDPKSALQDYLTVAENLDFEGGKVQKVNPFSPNVIPRVCRAKGAGKRSKASIMISSDKL